MADGPPKSARIGILGGSFNPPHVAHLIIAELVREQFGLDRILWIPNNQSPFKAPQDLAPADDRLEMTRLAIQENDAFSISDIETRRGGISYTVDTILLLAGEFPNDTFRLIIGSDSFTGFSGWMATNEIIKRARPIVYPRLHPASVGPPPKTDYRADYVDAPLLEISSTMIRERCRAGRTIRYMVPESVLEYIKKRGLYLE